MITIATISPLCGSLVMRLENLDAWPAEAGVQQLDVRMNGTMNVECLGDQLAEQGSSMLLPITV